jgi:hypothetical protein
LKDSSGLPVANVTVRGWWLPDNLSAEVLGEQYIGHFSSTTWSEVLEAIEKAFPGGYYDEMLRRRRTIRPREVRSMFNVRSVAWTDVTNTRRSLLIVGRNFARDSRAYMRVADSPLLALRVIGRKWDHGVMSAVTQTGKTMIRYRFVDGSRWRRELRWGHGRTPVEIVVDPGMPCTNDLVLAVAVSADELKLLLLPVQLEDRVPDHRQWATNLSLQ